MIDGLTKALARSKNIKTIVLLPICLGHNSETTLSKRFRNTILVPVVVNYDLLARVNINPTCSDGVQSGRHIGEIWSCTRHAPLKTCATQGICRTQFSQ